MAGGEAQVGSQIKYVYLIFLLAPTTELKTFVIIDQMVHLAGPQQVQRL